MLGIVTINTQNILNENDVQVHFVKKKNILFCISVNKTWFAKSSYSKFSNFVYTKNYKKVSWKYLNISYIFTHFIYFGTIFMDDTLTN